VAAAAAAGETRMLGLRELRVKESDRLAATAALLAVNGVHATAGEDALTVQGNGGAVPGGGAVVTHMDHRIAMSALVMGLAAKAPVSVDDAAFIETSFPGFAELVDGPRAAAVPSARHERHRHRHRRAGGGGQGHPGARLAAELGLPTSTPGCSTAASRGGCWTAAPTRATPAVAEREARRCSPRTSGATTCAARRPTWPPAPSPPSPACAPRCSPSSASSAGTARCWTGATSAPWSSRRAR
jgi:hypothetical protein